jgi:hypothetical protein
MPWKVYQEGETWCVHKETSDGGKGTKVACHPTEAEATAQLRALYASEKDMTSDYLLVDNYVTVRPGEPYRLLPFGKIVKNGKVREMTKDLAARFKLPHFKPPIKLGSHDEATPAGGHIVALEVRDDGLYAIPEVTNKGALALSDGDYRYHSPEVIWDGGGFEDPQTGAMIPGPLICGDALLHTPHLGEATALYSTETITEVSTMTTETVTVPMNFWDKLTARLFPEPPVLPEPVPPVVTEPDQMSAIVAERDTFKAELDAMKAEQTKTAQRNELVAELQDKEKFGAIYVELSKAQEAADMLAGMNDAQKEWVMRNFKAYIAQIKETAIVGEIGTSAQGDLTDDPKLRLDAAVKLVMAEKKVDYEAAVRLVPADLVTAAYPAQKKK